MKARSINWEFWGGIIAAIVTTIIANWCSYQQTHAQLGAQHVQLAAQQKEGERVHASTLLKDISSAVGEVRRQLRSLGSMFLEMQSCLAAPKSTPRACTLRRYDYDGAAAETAWINLNASIRAAAPFLIESEEIAALDSLAKIGARHGQAVGELMPVVSVDGAERIRARVVATMDELNAVEVTLENAVSRRLRAAK